MARVLGLGGFLALVGLLAGTSALGVPIEEPLEVTPEQTGEVDAVGDADGVALQAAKVVGDTVWVADWTFDNPDGSCNDTGWTKLDNRILNDGSNYWHIDSTFNGVKGIVNKAAILSKHDLSWVVPTGYGNDWDYSIICKYREPNATLSFNFVSNSEPGYDFISIEADSAGASESLVDFTTNPMGDSPVRYRDRLLAYSGNQPAGSVSGLALPNYGTAGANEVYIRFSSDGGYSDEDGYYRSHWGAGCVIDNITIAGTLTYTENFESTLNANVTFVNSACATPFGEWARLYKHISDNDRCVENTTCAWLWSDPNSLAHYPDMAFGPGQAVVHGWLDDIIVSPWVSFAGTEGALSTVLVWRRNASQRASQGCIGQNWSVRRHRRIDNTDTSTPGDSIDYTPYWAHSGSWNTFNSFVWGTNIWDMSSYVTDARDVQLRVRLTDFQLPYMPECGVPSTWNPGPGPFNDRIRIGRHSVRALSPAWNIGTDTRTLAQDCFPTELMPGVVGEHFQPNTDSSAPLYPYLYGTCACSNGVDIMYGQGRLIPGDSLCISVRDVRNVGGIASVKWYGAIVSGPHAGKAPAPYTVGTNGFFEVLADSCRYQGRWESDKWFVDLDDTYFRGGDQLYYFWYATDAAGNATSSPTGITASIFPPASVAGAEALTDGLYEVSYLPTIAWDAGYLARIAADAHGDLEPTAAEVAGSSQQNCILYYQHSNSARRSGRTQRTAFMYTLDRLGYAGHYDIYDVQGYGPGNNNQLGGRATVAQASGYSLVIEDDGRSNLTPNIPNGTSSSEKVDQLQWYRSYLAQGLTGRATTATLWLLGESTAYERATEPLFTSDFGLASITNDQTLAVNPELAGVGTFTDWNGCSAAFAGDLLNLNGACPSARNFDTAAASGTAVLTHRLQSGPLQGGGAVIMNRNPALHWNTIWMGFGWFDLRTATGAPGPDPAVPFMQKILSCVLPANCLHSPGTTGSGGDPTEALPRVTSLYQNMPNPFNPTTTIRFDLAREGHVTLRIYDVAGRVVKTLVDGKMTPGRNLTVTWSGQTESGTRAPSGVYFYKLEAPDFQSVKKMVLMK